MIILLALLIMIMIMMVMMMMMMMTLTKLISDGFFPGKRCPSSCSHSTAQHAGSADRSQSTSRGDTERAQRVPGEETAVLPKVSLTEH